VRLTPIALLLLGLQPTAPPEAREIVRRLEERQGAVADMTAHFVQTYRSGVLGREIVESGVLSLKPPGRMRFEYREPERKLFVADGEQYFFYVPADRQVITGSQDDGRGVAVRLLSGRAGILEEFDASFEEPGGRIVLVPRGSDPDVERVWLEVDESGRIRSIEVVDVQANRSEYRFDEIRENVGLKDGLFQFRVPDGVEVVSG
jgi:outer membrane lipoprotein carrier protein